VYLSYQQSYYRQNAPTFLAFASILVRIAAGGGLISF
jgi:hypothetical protein